MDCSIERSPMKPSNTASQEVGSIAEKPAADDAVGFEGMRSDKRLSMTQSVDGSDSSSRHIHLSAECTLVLGYPLGCSIWYNFQSTSDANSVDFCIGVIKSAVMDADTRKLIFTVEGRCTNDPDSFEVSMEEIHEDSISFATHCPVRVKMGQTDINGEILCAKPVFSEYGTVETINYSVILSMGQNQRKVVHNVPAKNVRYRDPKNGKCEAIANSSSVTGETRITQKPEPKKIPPSSAVLGGSGNEHAEVEDRALSKAINGVPQAAKVMLNIAVSLCQVWGADAEITISSLKNYCVQAFHHSIMDEWGLDNISYLVEVLVEADLLTTLSDETLRANDLNTKLKAVVQLKDVETALGQKLLTPGCFYQNLIDFVRRDCPHPS